MHQKLTDQKVRSKSPVIRDALNYNPSVSKSFADQETFQYDSANAKYSFLIRVLAINSAVHLIHKTAGSHTVMEIGTTSFLPVFLINMLI